MPAERYTPAAAVLILWAVVTAAWWARPGLAHDAAELSPRPTGMRIPINKADAVALSLLPGIGPTLGQRIVQDRLENGPFQSIEDLPRVPGIGKAKLRDVSPWVTCD